MDKVDQFFQRPVLVVSIFVVLTISGFTFAISQEIWARHMLVVSVGVLGVAVTVYAFTSYRDASQSKLWPVQQVKLISCQVRSRSSNKSTVYYPDISYTFSVQGKEYPGNTYNYSGTAASKVYAQKIVDELKAKSHNLWVHYNPVDPNRSVVMPGLQFVHFLRFFIGFSAIVGCIYYLDVNFGSNILSTAFEAY